MDGMDTRTGRTAAQAGAAPYAGMQPCRRRRWKHPLLERIAPERQALLAVLRHLGTQRPGALIDRYGERNVAAGLYYVLCQSKGYRAYNPGGLLRWLLERVASRSLQGWQLQRIAGFCRRFRDLPPWVSMVLWLWLRSLQWAWLGIDAYKRLYCRYAAFPLEQGLLRRPWAGFWRRLRYIVHAFYRPLPDDFGQLLEQADRLPGDPALWPSPTELSPLAYPELQPLVITRA